MQNTSTLLTNTSVSRRNRINNFLIISPYLVPLHQIVILGWSLLQHKLFQRVNSHTLAHNALDGGEARIIPPFNELLVNEPVELTFGEYSRSETEFREIVDFDGAETESFLDPFVEGVTVAVLDCTEGVGYSFD